MTERDRKVADNTLVIKLTTDLLTNKTKDLQIAAWLTEAMLKKQGFSRTARRPGVVPRLDREILGYVVSGA